MVLDASAMRCVASSTSEIAVELQHGKQSCHESPALVCRRERELYGFVRDRFIVERDSMHSMCIESRLEEKLTFARRIDFDVDGVDDMMVTIMSRTVTWVHLPGLKSQIASQPRKSDCANESGVREIRERRDPGIRIH